MSGLWRGIKNPFRRSDEIAIDQRHAIYYDKKNGTLAAVTYFKEKAKDAGAGFKVIEPDGKPGVKEVSQELIKKLGI